MSGRMFQSVIGQLKEATDRPVGVLDTEGTVLACSDPTVTGSCWPEIGGAASFRETLFVSDGRTFRPIQGPLGRYDYLVFADGTDETAATVCKMAAVAVSVARAGYEEKYDKATFVKNVLTDNIMPGDVTARARELRFESELPRAVFLVRQVDRTDPSATEVLANLFADRASDYVLSINETDIAVVHRVEENTTAEELTELAISVGETLNSELLIKTVIGIGTVTGHVRELADSYKEASVAIEVGKVFDTERSVISYENLGIGRLIYQLPTTLCEMFLSEVFKKNSLEALDQETLYTINKFFENNLNVSETSRKLFVHRNTLVYRLEKIKKITGLDLREFDHAIVFKVALMVRKYLNSRQRGSAG